MLDAPLAQYRFLHAYGRELIDGLDPADAFRPACPGGHHPAWILGHLTFSGLGVIRLLGGDAAGFERAQTRFGIGSEPEKTGADFPSLRAGWEDAHARAEAAAAAAGPDRLSLPNPRERMAPSFPTIGHLCSFLLAGHEAMHLGQLSAWRRARGDAPLY